MLSTDFNSFNALFQSAKILIGDLQFECEKFIKTLCRNLIQERFLRDSTKINPSNPSHFRLLEDVFLGDECAQYLLKSVQSGKIIPEDVSTLRKRCLGFYITAATQTLKRFPHGDSFFEVPSVCKSQDGPGN